MVSLFLLLFHQHIVVRIRKKAPIGQIGLWALISNAWTSQAACIYLRLLYSVDNAMSITKLPPAGWDKVTGRATRAIQRHLVADLNAAGEEESVPVLTHRHREDGMTALATEVGHRMILTWPWVTLSRKRMWFGSDAWV
jgi:hypothetical protein